MHAPAPPCLFSATLYDLCEQIARAQHYHGPVRACGSRLGRCWARAIDSRWNYEGCHAEHRQARKEMQMSISKGRYHPTWVKYLDRMIGRARLTRSLRLGPRKTARWVHPRGLGDLGLLAWLVAEANSNWMAACWTVWLPIVLIAKQSRQYVRLLLNFSIRSIFMRM
jgi:hypothetical protein